MRKLVRIGTRRSPLARVQTDGVIDLLTRAAPGFVFTPVPVETSGDRDRSPGSSPDFTDTIDRALLEGAVDLAVHSAKDLPAVLEPRFRILACPPRGDPRDCLVLPANPGGPQLGPGARVGSSSSRRRAQLLRWRSDLTVVEVRGNVDTRIRLVRSGSLDAAILALAGVTRLGRRAEVGRILSTSAFLPAPGQGALAVVGRAGDGAIERAALRIDHGPTHAGLTAERTFAAALGGDCRVPLGALSTVRGGTVSLIGEVLSADGSSALRMHRRGPVSEAERVGARLGRDMLERGALDLLGPVPR